MKRIATLVLLLGLCLTGSIPSAAQIFRGPNAQKQAEKASRKSVKKQQKLMMKQQKAQLKAAKRARRGR